MVGKGKPRPPRVYSVAVGTSCNIPPSPKLWQGLPWVLSPGRKMRYTRALHLFKLLFNLAWRQAKTYMPTTQDQC